MRIDKLAYNPKRKAFVIIEYKKGHSYSIVDHGYSYSSPLLNNKAVFVLKYFERSGNPLRKQEVDWSQSRGYFCEPKAQQITDAAMELKHLPFEFWKIKGYGNDTISFRQ